ncbi:MAG: hypothetical protein ACKVS5_14860 [Parvularculaceae bacterium]
MMITLLAAFLMQSATGADADADAPEVRRFDPYLLCVCKDVSDLEQVTFTGYANDAEVQLAEDGRSPLPRQATLFRVLKGPKDLASPAKVFHVTNPAKCGISFDYGKRYTIVAVKKGAELETNWCLMGKPR